MSFIKSFFLVFAIAFTVSACTTEHNIKTAKKGVVAVTTEYTEGTFGPNGPEIKNGIGTGFFIKENYIVTAYHVVGKASKIQIFMEDANGAFDAEFVYGDEFVDVAVIRLKDWDKFRKLYNPKYLEVAQRSEIQELKEVYSIGHPWGLTFSVSRGLISNELRRLEPNPKWFIQTDAKIYQGNSGGPLVDTNGRVLGINVMMLAKEGGSYGMAIPSSLFMKVFADIEKYGEARWANVGVLLSPNATVIDIVKDGAAEKSGLKKDDKITGFRIDEEYVEVKDSDYLIAQLMTFDYNNKVELILNRNGQEYSLEVFPSYKLSSDFKTELGKK